MDDNNSETGLPEYKKEEGDLGGKEGNGQSKQKRERKVRPVEVLDSWFHRYGIPSETSELRSSEESTTNYYQVGVDEVGRGPLFGIGRAHV